MVASKHQLRFSRWCQLGGPRLRLLADRVETDLLPAWATSGFSRCETDPVFGEPVPGGEILLSRAMGDDVAFISIMFDKYHRPAFQIALIRRKAKPPHDMVFSGNLVSSPKGNYQFWGKPWWWPGRFWSAAMARRTVAQVAARQAEALAFLETSARGRSISRDWRAEQ
jgi:hypothetical protein